MYEHIRLNDRVEAGEGEDHDTGRVIGIDGDQVTVAWDSHVTTTQSASLLRLMGINLGSPADVAADRASYRQLVGE